MWQSAIQLVTEQWKAVCAVVSAGLASIFYKRIKEWVMGAWRKGMVLVNLDERTKKIEEELSSVKRSNAEILAQLKPNGGSSLFDGVKRIEQGLGKLSEKIDHNDRVQWEINSSNSFRTDKNGKVTHVSQKLLSLLGAGENEFLNYDFINLITPRESLKFKTEYNEYVSKGLNYETTITFIRRSDNAHLHCNLNLLTIRDKNRDIIGFVANLTTL